MSQYPAATPSFTTKQDGVDYPQAAHINDIQAEVTAIGDALRTTLAHNLATSGALSVAGGSTLTTLQGGASTLASLQVTGASTFTGAVTFNGGINVSSFPSAVTFSSGAVVSTGVIRQDSLPAWSVYHSTVVAMGANSTQGANFDTQEFVRGDISHSTAANSSRVTITSTGLYHVLARALVHSGSNPTNRARIVQDDTTTLLETRGPILQASSSQATLVVQGLIRMSSTGYLTFQLTSENTAVSTHGSSSPFVATRFQGWFVG